jgi:hypothetical protein
MTCSFSVTSGVLSFSTCRTRLRKLGGGYSPASACITSHAGHKTKRRIDYLFPIPCNARALIPQSTLTICTRCQIITCTCRIITPRSSSTVRTRPRRIGGGYSPRKALITIDVPYHIIQRRRQVGCDDIIPRTARARSIFHTLTT